MPVNEDRPFGHIIKARNQIHQGGLATAADPYQGYNFAALYLKIDVSKDQLLVIFERHISENHSVILWLELHSILPLYNVRIGIENVIDSNGRSQAFLDNVVQWTDSLDRRIQHDERGHKRKEGPRCRGPRDHLVSPIPNNKGNTDATQQFHDRRRHGFDFYCLHFILEQPNSFFKKTLIFVRFHPKCLYDSRTREGLMEKGTHVCNGFLAPGAELPYAPAEFHNGNYSNRKNSDRNQGQFPVPVKDNE